MMLLPAKVVNMTILIGPKQAHKQESIFLQRMLPVKGALTIPGKRTFEVAPSRTAGASIYRCGHLFIDAGASIYRCGRIYL